MFTNLNGYVKYKKTTENIFALSGYYVVI